MSDQDDAPADPGPDTLRVRAAEPMRRTRQALPRPWWRSAAPLAAMFVLGAASGVGAYLVTDLMKPGSAYCVVSPGTSERVHDLPPGALVEADSGCSPGEVGPVCGRAKHDARGRVTSFESQRCDSSLGSFLWFALDWADVAVAAVLAVFVLGLLWAVLPT